MKNNTIKKSKVLKNRYEVQPNSYVTIDLPNGKSIDIWVNESGRYTDITVNDHSKLSDHKITTEKGREDFKNFTTSTNTVVGKGIYDDYYADYTVVNYKKFNQK